MVMDMFFLSEGKTTINEGGKNRHNYLFVLNTVDKQSNNVFRHDRSRRSFFWEKLVSVTVY